eukprot:7876131-Ditylum_brightwellii.AAC.1
MYEDLMNASTSNYVRKQLFRNQLNQNQCMLHDLVVRSTLLPSGQSSTDGGNDVGRLHILFGQVGGGKSYAFNAILTTLTFEHNLNADNYKVCATSCKLPTLIGGSTFHSHKEGFGLPVGRTSYSPLSEAQEWKNTKEDWQILRQKWGRFSKGFQRWGAEGFNTLEC